MTPDMLLRYFLPLYFLLFVSTAFVWRSYLVWKATGVNPYRLGNADTAHDFIGRVLNVLVLACAVTVLLYVFWPAGYVTLVPIPWLEHPAVTWTGLFLLLFALLWVLIAQHQMGRSWRIGIDSHNKTALVEHGLFRISRNPIFLGTRCVLLGLFLVLPTALTFAVLVLGDAVVQIQVRLEEAHLATLHGQSYSAYCRRVRRWL